MTFKQYGNSFSVEAFQKKEQRDAHPCQIGHVKMSPSLLQPSSDKEVGIDIGLKIFAYLSDGTTIEEIPAFSSKKKRTWPWPSANGTSPGKKSKERTKLNKRVTRVHERTKNRRKHFAHQQSRKIVNGVPVHRCRGPGSAQYGEKSESVEKYCRCGLVAITAFLRKQSGRGWQRSDSSEPCLHVGKPVPVVGIAKKMPLSVRFV